MSFYTNLLKKILLLLIIIILVVFVIFPLVYPPNMDCTNTENEENISVDTSWVKSTKTIYKLDKYSKLYKTDFDSNVSEIIFDHNYTKSYASFKMSPDGRYIIYGRLRESNKIDAYYLHDTLQDTNTKIIETLNYDGLQIEFSPDSSQIGFVHSEAMNRDRPKRLDIFIMSLSDFSKKFIDYPEYAVIPKDKVRGKELKWSLDGKYLYLAFNGHLTQGHTREYHKIDLLNNSSHKIDGNYDKGYTFIEHNIKIKTHKNPYPQSHIRHSKLKVSSNKTIAFVDDDYNLIINDKDRNLTKIAQGTYCQCEGVTIGIIDWIENGKYLIYKIRQTTYIYGLAENRKAILFMNSNRCVFGWNREN